MKDNKKVKNEIDFLKKSPSTKASPSNTEQETVTQNDHVY